MQRFSLPLVVVLGVGGLTTHAAPPPNTSESSAGVIVKTNPPGCLVSWPKMYTFEGRLTGAVYPGDPQENPPIPSQAYMYVRLLHPISVCAFYAGSTKIPAYANVWKIGMQVWAPNDYRAFMKRWGNVPVLVTGGLDNISLGSPRGPGPIRFVEVKRFCYSDSSGNAGTVFTCLPWEGKQSVMSELRKEIGQHH